MTDGRGRIKETRRIIRLAAYLIPIGRTSKGDLRTMKPVRIIINDASINLLRSVDRDALLLPTRSLQRRARKQAGSAGEEDRETI